MSESKILTFFNGSFIDLGVLRVLGVPLEKYEAAGDGH
jgi:hypothetical protein